MGLLLFLPASWPFGTTSGANLSGRPYEARPTSPSQDASEGDEGVSDDDLSLPFGVSGDGNSADATSSDSPDLAGALSA